MSARADAHFDAEHLMEFEAGCLDASAQAGVQVHLEVCGRCSAELALVKRYLSVPENASLDEGRSDTLRELFHARLTAQDYGNRLPEERAIPHSRVRVSRSTRGWRAAALIAASVALLVVAASLFRYGPLFSTGDSQLRALGDAEWAQELRVAELEDGRLELDWPHVEGTEEYRVLLLDMNGETVHETVSLRPPLRLEPSTLSRFPAAGSYFAVVEFTWPTGEVQRSVPRALPIP